MGPLTAKPRDNRDELNFFRVPGTSVFDRHFAQLEFSGPEGDRILKINVIESDGTLLWARTIEAKNLRQSVD